MEGAPSEGRLGKLALRREGEALSQAFALLDCHDGSIRAAGGLLIEAEGELLLCTRQGLLRQTAARDGDMVADLAEGPVKAALRDTSPLRSLLAVGAGTAGRSRFALVDGEGKTRARADAIVLRTPDATVTLAALHGLRGYDRALAALSAHLRGLGRPHEIADLEAMLFPGHTPYDPKITPELAPDETAHDAANDIIRAQFGVMRQNEAGIIADHDTEFLHDFRVALRKIRSVLSLFRGVYEPTEAALLKRRFSALMAPTGRMRDLDVYLLERAHYYALLPESLHDGLSRMFDIFARERRREHRKIIRWLESEEYRAAMAALDDLFRAGPARGAEADHPAHDYACGLIWKRYRKVCRVAAGIGADTPDEEVHELRIQCKKLRYLMAFFAPLFPKGEFRALIAPLKTLQDNLGLFNDYSVQQRTLGAFVARHPATRRAQDLEMATSIGALIAVLHQRQQQERARIEESLVHFDSPAIRRRFARLFRGKGA